MKKVLWEEMRRTEIETAARAGGVVIIPTGSTEQHGNHLPVNTDTNCCFTIARCAAESIDDFPVLVVSPAWCGYSPDHMKFPGAITLKLHTYIDVLTEIAMSIASHGFKKLFLLNGHGGNTGVVNTMRVKLASEDNVVASCIGYTYWRLIDQELQKIGSADGRIGHSGEVETSLQLYLQPDLVDKKAISWALGVLGNPSKATYEKGKELFETAVAAVAEVLRDFHSGRFEEDITWGEEISTAYKKRVPL